ncbi:uncharacterized protein KY384_004868 [Bacidia gigantensis]|uniref:uncharacterized protein n=1 Tax=Bacidia gigantensis TaxID=2732470 RepID=UPI001D04FA5D|nr:uncharacterized protein KY384_004868 [Bacidia gigantensis]KAG8530366.1 hypothetical protein KY384_004868 [Bacidia gigantensis]
MATSHTAKLLWTPASPSKTRTAEFLRFVEKKHEVRLADYEALRQWSISDINIFWEDVWQFTGFQDRMWPRPHYFVGAKLNFAENLLFPTADPPEDSFAVIEANETERFFVTWRELRERVRQCSHAMRAVGLEQGDRVAGFVANHCNALVAMLAATSIGAVWTAVSPDTGVQAVLDRIQQIAPVFLVADNGVMYNGRVHQTHDKIQSIVEALPQLKTCVVFETVPNTNLDIASLTFQSGKACWHSQFVQSVPNDSRLEFTQLEPDHPVYILYSSGTTGKPKCIVHGAVGTLIQHKKEHDIQCSIRPGDKLFYFTTCTWMMWHWLVSGLATGATIVLYDGSPFRPLDEDGNGEMAMPSLIRQLGITHFGTSAKYLSILEQKNVYASQEANLSTLRAVYSTGSPLAPSTFEYVYRCFGSDVNLGSITGGTDIISLFGAPSQISPVYAGEIQVRGLGMAVEAWDYEGKTVTGTGEAGDLVCVKPFPCQPIKFWGEQGETLYERSYFEQFPGVWHHGDFVRINPATGGMIMLGRSDGVLKPAGVRFGSSEIYNVLSQHFPEVEDSLCIGRRRQSDLDETVVLFVKMAQGQSLTDPMRDNVKNAIRRHLSARHVPHMIDETPEIPITINGKKSGFPPTFVDTS